jgi:Cu+-exporting ATPase
LVRLLVALLAPPVIALSMIPALQFDGWMGSPDAGHARGAAVRPVVPPAAAEPAPPATTMDTLVSLGILAATGGRPRRRTRASRTEVAAGVTLFLLAGWYAARAVSRAGPPSPLAQLGQTGIRTPTERAPPPIEELAGHALRGAPG